MTEIWIFSVERKNASFYPKYTRFTLNLNIKVSKSGTVVKSVELRKDPSLTMLETNDNNSKKLK